MSDLLYSRTSGLADVKNLRLYTTSPVVIMLIDKALSNDKPNGHLFEADWLHSKRDALSSNRKVDGSRLTSQGVRLTVAHSPQATGMFCGRLEAALLVAHGATGYYSTY